MNLHSDHNIYSVLSAQIRAALSNSAHWSIVANIANGDRTPNALLKLYKNHFSSLTAEIRGGGADSDLARRRLIFVAANYHSVLGMEFSIRRQTGSLGLPALISTILWQSRSAALLSGDINDHISLAALMTHPALSHAPRSVAAEIKSMTDAGLCVTCPSDRDRRKKWVSLSCDHILQMWEQSLLCFLLRIACLSTLEPETETADRNNWVRDLGMPAEIFDLACKKNLLANVRIEKDG